MSSLAHGTAWGIFFFFRSRPLGILTQPRAACTPATPVERESLVIIAFIGDVVGQSGRRMVGALSSPRLRASTAPTCHRQRGELRGRFRRQPDRHRRDGGGRASTSSPAATTCGTSAKGSRCSSRRTTSSGPPTIRRRAGSRSRGGPGHRRARGRAQRAGARVHAAARLPASAPSTVCSTTLPATVQIIVVDFHGEATSEKIAMGYYLDGRVSLVIGTHTHVPTRDARSFPGRHRLRHRRRHDGFERLHPRRAQGGRDRAFPHHAPHALRSGARRRALRLRGGGRRRRHRARRRFEHHQPRWRIE